MSIRSIELNNYTWLDISDPKDRDMEFLAKKYKFHHLALEDCLSFSQRPKIDEYDGYLFIVFHLPKYIKETFRTVANEIDVFLGKNYLITVHREIIKPLDNLFLQVKRKNNSSQILTGSPAYLLYELLDQVFTSCFPMLDKIGDKLDRIEDELYEDQSRKTLEEISLIELDIINFRRIINPQRYAIKDLEVAKMRHIGENLEVYFDDIVDKIERIWDILNNYKEVSEVLRRTSESIINHRLNEIIKILTIFSVMMLPLTVITGFYGMNIVGLPLASHGLSAEIITGVLALVVVLMLLYFNRRKWL